MVSTIVRMLIAGWALIASVAAPASDLQNPVDRSDASVVAEDIGRSDPLSTTPERPAALDLAPAAVTADIEPFVVGAVRIQGATALPVSAFARAIEPYLGTSLDRDDLAALARDVAAVARGAGYGLATAWVPPQSVGDGVLVVRLEEGRIDQVEATGPGAGLVERSLMILVNGEPVTTRRLERHLLLAGDLAGVTLGRPRLVRLEGRNVLRIAVARERLSAWISLDNWGSHPVGPVRTRAAAVFNGVVGSADRLTTGAVVTPLEPREFQLVHLSYAVPVGTSGTEASLRGYAARTNPGSELRDLDLLGRSYEVELGASHPFLRSRKASLWGSLALAVRDSRLDRAGLAIRDDRITAATASVYATAEAMGGRARVRLALTQGMDLLEATETGDPLASRADASGSFTKLELWARHHVPLGGRFSAVFALEGQVADGPLLASEEAGLGGKDLLRAFDYREHAGENSVAAGAEIRFDLADLPKPLRDAQLYAFVDAGHAQDLNGGQGGGSLASAGGGLRVRIERRVSAGVEIAVPLTEGAFEPDPRPRFSFTLAVNI